MSNWLQLEGSQQKIDAVYRKLNGVVACDSKPPSNEDSTIHYPIHKVLDGPNEYRGIYCHYYLVPHILSWCSADYAIDVSIIVTKYYIAEKDEKIFSLEALNKKLDVEFALAKQRHEELLVRHEVTITQLEDTATSRDLAHDKIDKLTESISEAIR
jgi:hypothetical protein